AHRLVRTPRLPPHRRQEALPLRRRALRHPAAPGPALRSAGEGAVSGWVRVCATAELLPGESKVAWDGDTPILVVNLDGDFYAVEDQCTHEDFELSAGAISDGQVECTLHGARFDLRTGEALCAPAYAPVAKFPVKVED